MSVATVEFSTPESVTCNLRTARLNHALQILETASGDRAIDDAAAAVRISSSRLRHLVKQETGMSPTQYVRAARMKNARRLLVTSSLLVKQVMWEAGFTDISHFVRDYKKAFGETPTETRNREFAAMLALDQNLAQGSQLDREIMALGHLTAMPEVEEQQTVYATN